MTRFCTIALGLCTTIASIALAQAADPAFDVKPGLWEITSTGAATGAPPIPAEALAKLSPEQRAKMEAAMQAAMARSSQPRTSKSCITQKQLEKTFAGTNDKNCKQTIVSRTATLIEARVECTGEQKTSGTVRFQALSRETVRGEVKMAISGGGNTMNSNHTLEGKWLGADCGSVKPSGE
ncbi:MAG: DUF3617 domain-containing protein [Alphaproteobacteria bacterium]|nr:DUF3617 domain-containing protein [Alphaproteobacteria bacterium]